VITFNKMDIFCCVQEVGFSDSGQYLEVSVTEPQKQGDGMSSFLVYRVTTRTNIALFRRKEFAVWRRFSDFLGLHSKLAEKYMKKVF